MRAQAAAVAPVSEEPTDAEEPSSAVAADSPSSAQGGGTGVADEPGRQLVGDRPKVRYVWQLPQVVGPEVVLVGRSNAGKSTLLNSMLASQQQSVVAPVSRKGGRTRTLTWYPVGFQQPVGWSRDGRRTCMGSEDELALSASWEPGSGTGFCLVDCFGLGPVDYSLQSKRLQSWGPLLGKFLSQRRSLCAVYHLVSSEYSGALTEGDEQLIEIFKRSVQIRRVKGMEPFRFVSVLTKSDLHTAEDLSRIVGTLRAELETREQRPDEVVTCSSMSEDGSGISDFTSSVFAAASRGWSVRAKWRGEASREVGQSPKPQKRSAKDQKAVRKSFVLGRRQPDGKQARGGAGAVTQLPPAV